MMSITVFYEDHASNIFLASYNLRDMDRAAPLSLKHTPAEELSTMHYPQTSAPEPKTDIHSLF